MLTREFFPSIPRRPRLTPRSAALLAAVSWTMGVTLLLSWMLVTGRTPDLLRRLDLWIYDSAVRATLQPRGEPQVTVLALDEASLEVHGQWPWPRDRVATLVQRLFDTYGARALAFDIVFAEPDRSDAASLREHLARAGRAPDTAARRALDAWLDTLDRDAALARALQGRPVVLGYYFSTQGARKVGALPEPFLPVDFARDVGLWPPRGDGFGANLPALMQAAERAGHFNPSPDIDGVTRRAALLVEHEGMLYPSLPLATLTMLAGKEATVDFGRETTWDGRSVTEFLSVGPYRLPVDEQTRALVPFFGPSGSLPTVSAAQVLAGTADPALLKGRVVVMGATAPGLKDARVTPVDRAQPGVEVHASLLQGALGSGLPSQPHYTAAAVLTTMGVVALAMLAGSRRLRLSRFGLAALATAAAILLLAGWLWMQQRVVLPVALPLVQLLLLVLGLTALGYMVENRSKQAINRLFGQYVPPELIGEMNEDPARYSMSARSAELTVMFADMRGFTTLSERMEPQALAALMNSVLTDLSRVIRADHLGTIDKYIGDCVMAFWGAPVQRADHAAAAVAAALDMTRSLARLLPTLDLPAGATVSVGIGVQTGPAVVGNMGSAYRVAYTVLGDTVNTASRLEGLTKVYGAAVVTGDAVKAAAEASREGRAFLWRRLDLVRVKGREAPLLLHEPLCRLEEATSALREQVARHETALDAYLGRDFAQARHAWVSLHEAHPCELYGLWAERAAAAEAHPPPPDWDGVWSHTTK
jgi:adenylate cyclase